MRKVYVLLMFLLILLVRGMRIAVDVVLLPIAGVWNFCLFLSSRDSEQDWRTTELIMSVIGGSLETIWGDAETAVDGWEKAKATEAESLLRAVDGGEW